ncbi:zinc ABC transporter substrate-binding protein [Pseudosulfitobacter koreensis]|uniref:High-affinity zinc uptake system protein ZnuA n=1 Tax=Pseudosulfitobacter koreensis TaxID=2968472 RepID=A0ABT1YY41_9RHOB|nr:zinc ABC transporter substrate-binding protein [Pseudosulfitobacter koreense]MCR8825797.1 zinc ABC transporter substrate-binding protein [Pseudosulfitobacter koreense]
MIPKTALALVFGATAAGAQAPQVAVDIAPVHALVAQVMQGVGAPELIVPPGASPHGYALQPLQMRSLSQADAVIWVGPALTPWLDAPLDVLASDASQLVLMDAPQMLKLKVREGAGFHGRDPGDGVEEVGTDAALPDATAGNIDPHAWLAPENAALWMLEIAVVLGALDPDNALTYEENARDGAAALAGLTSEVNAILEPVRSRPFVVSHDAFQYFERSFHMPAIAALSGGDGQDPDLVGAAQIREVIQTAGATCVLSEPQLDSGLADAVGAARMGVADPLGATLDPGPALYGDLLRGLATALAACLRN